MSWNRIRQKLRRNASRINQLKKTTQTYGYNQDPETEKDLKSEEQRRRRRIKTTGSLSLTSLRRRLASFFFFSFYKSVKDDRINGQCREKKKTHFWFSSTLLVLSLSFTPSSLENPKSARKRRNDYFVWQCLVFCLLGWQKWPRAVTWRLNHMLWRELSSGPDPWAPLDFLSHFLFLFFTLLILCFLVSFFGVHLIIILLTTPLLLFLILKQRI